MNNQKNMFENLAEQNDKEEFSFFIENNARESAESGNIFEKLANQEKEKENSKFGFFDTAKDIAEQVVTKGISGVAGAYGNLFDAIGQPKPGTKLPGQQALSDIESGLRDKMSRGDPLSFHELMFLADNDQEQIPYFPTSKEVQKGIENITGVGEGKTEAGRVLGHGSQFIGEAVAYPGSSIKTLATTGLSGVAGQTLRELGAPEWLASTTEITGNIVPAVIQGKVAPASKAGQEIAEAGRHLNLTEKQIAPLIQSDLKSSLVSKVARKGERTKKAFQSIKESLGDSYSTIKNSPDAKKQLSNIDQDSLISKFLEVKDDLGKTLQPSPDKKAALDFIEGSIKYLENNYVSPEYLVNFWQDINKAVKWNSISGGKKALTRLKDPLLETMKKVSPSLAEDFELTNKLYSKYSQISKKLKPDLVDSFVNKGEIISAIPSGVALATGNPYPLMGLAGEVATRILAREMLINPYFQNLSSKLVQNFNSGSLKGVEISVKQARECMERKHPNEDWAFLTED